MHGVRVGMYPGVWPEGWLGSFVHPLGGVVCRGHAQYPAFATNSLFLLLALQKWQLGFFGLLVSFDHNLPQLHMHTVIFSPFQFLPILQFMER